MRATNWRHVDVSFKNLFARQSRVELGVTFFPVIRVIFTKSGDFSTQERFDRLFEIIFSLY